MSVRGIPKFLLNLQLSGEGFAAPMREIIIGTMFYCRVEENATVGN